MEFDESDQAADGFAAIGARARLDIIRFLVRAGSEGISTGDIQHRTKIPASTLAHHLRTLKEAGLMRQEKVGRWVINRADFDRLENLARFLLAECCADSAVPGDKPDSDTSALATGDRHDTHPYRA